MSEIWDKYRTHLCMLPIALTLVALFVFALPPHEPGLIYTSMDYPIPQGTPFYVFIPVLGILSFVLVVLWVCRGVDTEEGGGIVR